MEEVLDTVEVGRPRREPEGPQFLDPEQAEALIEQACEQGVELMDAYEPPSAAVGDVADLVTSTCISSQGRDRS